MKGSSWNFSLLAAVVVVLSGNFGFAEKLPLRPTGFHLRHKSPSEFNVSHPEAHQNLDAFESSIMLFEVNAKRDEVFRSYLEANPIQFWNQPLVKVRAVYSPSKQKTLYRKDLAREWSGIEEGMKIFLDMAILPFSPVNKPSVMVAIEVLSINEKERYVDFAYLEGSPPYGIQRIEFSPAESDLSKTSIRHTAWFRSHRKAVEQVYPIYHFFMLSSLHRKQRKLIDHRKERKFGLRSVFVRH